ncbi:MAG TPA: hypothetical protein VFC51_07055 [Chloroflexota bacterium]|nr:hypothetical protein [Chloroflexota bacterium]
MTQSRWWAAAVTVLLLAFALIAWPTVVPSQVPGPLPDSRDYAFAAEGLLHGAYEVSWDGPSHVPRYSPGFSILLIPAVAVGGISGAVWVPFASALLLGVLAAILASRIGEPLAAPVAVAATLFTAASILFSRIVMSDLPSACLVVLEMAMLAIAEPSTSFLAAGVIAGALVWIRPTNFVLLGAGLAACSARATWRRRALLYLVAAMPLVVGLALWQWSAYGSPLATGYQAQGFGRDGSGGIGSLFSVTNLWKSPRWLVDMDAHPLHWQLPNIVLYPLALLGSDFFLSLPFVSAIGLFGLLRFRAVSGARGAVGRFGVTALLLTLAVHLPYWYQAERFLMAPAAIANVVAGVLLGDWIAQRKPGLHAARISRPRVSRLAFDAIGPPLVAIPVMLAAVGLIRVSTPQGLLQGAVGVFVAARQQLGHVHRTLDYYALDEPTPGS